jgi:hypothetical protein
VSAIRELTPALRSAMSRAGARAHTELAPETLPQLVHSVDGLLPDNGIDLPFREIQRLLSSSQIVDVLGRPGATHGLHTVVVEARSGERMLAMLRHGSRRDIAAEQFFTDVAYAAGMEDFVAPMALAVDARSALVQLIPHPSLASAGVSSAPQVERSLARGYLDEGLDTAQAATEARVDRELAASLDYITGHADRHAGNALIDAHTGRLTLVDHELIGGGAYYGAHSGATLLDPLLQGGRPGGTCVVEGERVALRRVELSNEARAHLADVEPAAITAAHDRLAATPLPGSGDDLAAWIRSTTFRDAALRALRNAVEDGGWNYIPIG